MSVNRGALTSTHKVTGGCYVALLFTINVSVHCGFSISETHNLFLIACFFWCLVKAISIIADNLAYLLTFALFNFLLYFTVISVLNVLMF